MTLNQKGINLALQGGGAHGAFAWGVLDRLLEDGRLNAEGISATSAGAMNAVVFAYGIAIAGAEGAREKLHEFWWEISRAGQLYSPVRALPWERWFNGFGMAHSVSFHLFEAITRVFSPYQLNPLNFNPLRNVLERVVDFDRLRRCNKATRLYISATNVRTGKIRVFRNEEMSADVILASACLPYIFQAVEIDGEHYWDGGYMGNPAIFPLIYNSQSKDVVLIHINPLERAKLPTTASDIFNRINEISFNSSLMREMRAIAFVTRLIDNGALDGKTYRRMLIHSICSDDVMIGLGVASKLNPDWDFLCHLRDVGRRTAGEWLEANWGKVGSESSIDIDAVFL
ncbi:MAG TPA: patatin-like phospholipase family protein [Hyphomicrobiaceae bacterium]|nr:patatin-like phospholipase family protein [Hyphomicrobiaceae bacterium]